MAVKVVDALEMVEVENQEHACSAVVEHFIQRAHQLAPVGEAGRGIGVGIALGEPLGRLIGFERFLEVLGTSPAEQDDRDVEQESDLQRAGGIRQRARAQIAAGRTWLPSATNSSNAATVAHVVMM